MKKNIGFILFILLLGVGLFLIYQKFDFNIKLFETSKTEPSNQATKVEETKNNNEAVQTTMSVEEKLQYIYSYDKEKKEITFGIKNTSEEDMTLNFDSSLQFDVHLSNIERNFLWKLSSENSVAKKGTKLIIGAGKEVKSSFVLPDTLKSGNYTLTAFYTAKELTYKETLVEKIYIENKTETAGGLNENNGTNSEFLFGMIYSLKHNPSTKTMTVSLINATDMPKTLHFDTEIWYNLSIYKGKEKIAEINHKETDDSVIINGDAKKNFEEKLSVTTGKYKAALKVYAAETMGASDVTIDFEIK